MSAAKRFKRDVTAQRSEETLIQIEQFRKELNEYDECLAQIVNGLNNPKEYIFDVCDDLR